MNILSINNFGFKTPFKANSNETSTFVTPNFGLKMARPLTDDVVSFKGGKTKKIINAATEALTQTEKMAGSYADAARVRDIKDKIGLLEQAHKDLKRNIMTIYKGSVAEKNRTEGCSLTLLDRIKTTKSYKEKSTIVNIKEIDDGSGFAFILEDISGFKTFTDNFNKLLKKGYTVVDYEYHRIPPLFNRGQIQQTFDSLNPSTQQRLKKDILKLNPQMSGHMVDRDSKAGYSAIHLILRDKKGQMHEIQVYTRAMADVKAAENLVYKLKNGKSVPNDYLKVSPHLKMLMPPKKGTAISPEAVKIQEEMKKYCWNAYVDALSHPFTPNKILRPDLEKYPNLKDYDLNALSLLLKL